jgi:hypothetical protein
MASLLRQERSELAEEDLDIRSYHASTIRTVPIRGQTSFLICAYVSSGLRTVCPIVLGVREDLVVVATRESFVTKEVDGGVFDPARLLGLPLQMTQAVRLIPSLRKHIEGDLAANRVSAPSQLAQCPNRKRSYTACKAITHSRPKSANFCCKIPTNVSRILCSRSYR